mmetsp:Transcript_17444/g.29307  ORF Transcript_17444/g.29307 Transcript_17444/m.29307 type:complete len:299 (+) Transcript_17444:449-1345(+)
MMICIPPNGSSFRRICWNTKLTLSRISSSSIETSSSMRTSVRSTRLVTCGLSRTMVTRSSLVSRPRPMPEKECNVVPPTFTAAIPVDAVTATTFPLPLSTILRYSTTTDFPVPAPPLTKIFLPATANFTANCCSSSRSTLGSAASPIPSPPPPACCGSFAEEAAPAKAAPPRGSCMRQAMSTAFEALELAVRPEVNTIARNSGNFKPFITCSCSGPRTPPLPNKSANSSSLATLSSRSSFAFAFVCRLTGFPMGLRICSKVSSSSSSNSLPPPHLPASGDAPRGVDIVLDALIPSLTI